MPFDMCVRHLKTSASTFARSVMVQPSPMPLQVATNMSLLAPATQPVVATPMRRQLSLDHDYSVIPPPPSPGPSAIPPRPCLSPNPQAVAGRSQRIDPSVSIRSTHTARRQPSRMMIGGKGKEKYCDLSSASEDQEEDELESEIDTGGWLIKQEPLSDHLDFQAYAQEVQLDDMELHSSECQGSRARSTATNAPKAELKTPLLVPEVDDEDSPTVVDRLAAAGENNPPCSSCARRNIPCQYVVDEWVTQCKLCQRQRVGCSVSAAKTLALKSSGRKRLRPSKVNNITRVTVKKELKEETKAHQATPMARNSRKKKTGLGSGSCHLDNCESSNLDSDNYFSFLRLSFEQRRGSAEWRMNSYSSKCCLTYLTFRKKSTYCVKMCKNSSRCSPKQLRRGYDSTVGVAPGIIHHC